MYILQCTVCNITRGNSFRCSEGGCNAWFHISCGIFAGFSFQIDRHNKQRILMHCSNHCYIRDKVIFLFCLFITFFLSLCYSFYKINNYDFNIYIFSNGIFVEIK